MSTHKLQLLFNPTQPWRRLCDSSPPERTHHPRCCIHLSFPAAALLLLSVMGFGPAHPALPLAASPSSSSMAPPIARLQMKKGTRIVNAHPCRACFTLQVESSTFFSLPQIIMTCR